ncbi:hypothetical protein D3C81_1487910 [compost metagenome]
MQGVDLDLLAQRRLTHLGFVHAGAPQRVVLAQRPGIGHQQQQAAAVGRPVEAVDRLHDAGEGVLVERVAGHLGRPRATGQFGETLRVLALLQVDQHLADILQAGGLLDVVAKADQAEAHAAQIALAGDPPLHFLDHLADPVDVGLHGHRGVHHQHDAGAEIVGGVALTAVAHHLPGFVPRVDGGDVEQLHRQAVGVEGLARIEDRQQVELLLGNCAFGRFHGDDVGCAAPLDLHLAQVGTRRGRVGQVAFDRRGVFQEHHR